MFTKPFFPRWLLAAACVVVVAAGLIWRVVDLQLNHHAFLKEQGDARHLRIEKIPAHRGMLLDRNGEPLAVSTPLASVWVNPRKLVDSRSRWPELERALTLDPGSIEQVIEGRSNRGFVYVRRHVDPSVAEAVGALGMNGVHLKPEYRRYYPMGGAASHVLGFTGIDDAGQEGLELAFDDVLSGESGARRVIKDRLGRIVENLERIRPAYPGRDTVLSIDRRIQSLTYRALRQGVATSSRPGRLRGGPGRAHRRSARDGQSAFVQPEPSWGIGRAGASGTVRSRICWNRAPRSSRSRWRRRCKRGSSVRTRSSTHGRVS